MNNITKRQMDFLKAAIDIVSREGISKLTIRNVAAAVGVTEPAVYRHFPNKLALLETMLKELQSAMFPYFRMLKKGSGAPKESLREFIYGLFKEFEIRPAYAPFIFSEEIFHNEAKLRNKLEEVMSENIHMLTEAFEVWQTRKVCRQDISAQQIAFLTLASIRFSVSRWHVTNGKVKLNTLAEDIFSTLTALLGLNGEMKK